MKDDGFGPGPKQPPARGRRSAGAGSGSRRRRPGTGNAWAEEIYSAPQDKRSGDGESQAKVIVSTRLRKPRVHLMAPATAAYVDLRRYMGRWYEIARLPYFTQRRCVKDVQADYVLGDDGMVYVTNRCTHQDGNVGTAKGVARVVDRSGNARLEVSFRTLYGVHVLWDDYWIIGVGADYDYALVGQPTRKRGWVLARDPAPREHQIQRWLAEFAEQGFPVGEFLRTRQEGGDGAALEGPTVKPTRSS